MTSSHGSEDSPNWIYVIILCSACACVEQSSSEMRGKRVSDDLFRVICITFDETGNLSATARALHLPFFSVRCALKRRVGTSYLQRKVCLGRPILLVPRSFLQHVKRHRFSTWTQLSHHFLISRWSVKRACARLGYRSHAAVVDRLTDKQKRTRLQWAAHPA